MNFLWKQLIFKKWKYCHPFLKLFLYSINSHHLYQNIYGLSDMHVVNTGCYHRYHTMGRDSNFSTSGHKWGINSSSVKKPGEKQLPILIVAFPFRPLPRTRVLFFCLAVLTGSFTDGEVIHWYWKRNNKYSFQLQVIYEGLISIGN